jgi:hypothetical protein
MFQIDTIVEAVTKHSKVEDDLAAAIVGFYLLDIKFIAVNQRKKVLDALKERLGKTWTISKIRGVNPKILGDLQLPSKEQPVTGDNVSPTHKVEVTPNAALQYEWPEGQGPTAVQHQTNTNTISHSEETSMTNTAITLTSAPEVILAHVKENKKAIKAQVEDFKELVESDKKRSKAVHKWIEADEDREEAWKAFNAHLDGAIKDKDTLLITFVRLSEKPKKEFRSLEKAMKSKAKEIAEASGEGRKDVATSFGLGAIVGGLGNMFMNGFTPGAAVGTAVAAGGCYYLGTKIDEQGDDDGIDKRAGAFLLGGGLGYGGAALGRMAEVHVIEQYAEWFGGKEDGEVSDSVSVVIHNNNLPADSTQNSLRALGLI